MPNPNREIDTSFLSADQTDKRGIIHRDLIAHALRWSHVVKELTKVKSGYNARLLDVGCGVEAPLAKTLYSNRLTSVSYLGIDYGPIEPKVKFTGAFQPSFLEKTDAATWLSRLADVQRLSGHGIGMPIEHLEAQEQLMEAFGGQPNYVTSFEVFEHMLPDRLAKLLVALRAVVTDGAKLWVSTPVYNARVGAAGNHINELTIATLGTMLEAAGFEVVHRWGTFASQRDYLPQLENLVELTSPEGTFAAEHGFTRQLFHELNDYYDANLTAILWAPLFPDQARNNLWELRPRLVQLADTGTSRYQVDRQFPGGLPPLGSDRGQCLNEAAWAAVEVTLGLAQER